MAIKDIGYVVLGFHDFIYYTHQLQSSVKNLSITAAIEIDTLKQNTKTKNTSANGVVKSTHLSATFNLQLAISKTDCPPQ